MLSVPGSAWDRSAREALPRGSGKNQTFCQMRGRQAEALKRVLPRVRDIRRVGAAALDLVWTAAGRFDAYYERGLKAWDIAAGSLIVREAGGVVTDFLGRDGYLKSGNVVVANRRIHSSMLDIIRQTMV